MGVEQEYEADVNGCSMGLNVREGMAEGLDGAACVELKVMGAVTFERTFLLMTRDKFKEYLVRVTE